MINGRMAPYIRTLTQDGDQPGRSAITIYGADRVDKTNQSIELPTMVVLWQYKTVRQGSIRISLSVENCF